MAISDYTHAALLLMDIQPGIIERLPNGADYLGQAKAAVNTAHKHNLPVIYVVVGFRSNFPEVSPNNQSFSSLKAAAHAGLIDPKPSIEPTGTDIVVTKRRVSAFAGSDLDIVLRAQGITHLILGGIATSGVVLSTVREAADKDFQLTVVADLCRDFDDQVHNILIEKVFPKQSAVCNLVDFTHSIEQLDK